MGRQPKYRAWYKPLGVMIEPENLVMINFDTKVLGVYMEMDGKGYHVLRMSDFELILYTGVYDEPFNEDEVEISDGDIIRFECEDIGPVTCEVKFQICEFLLISNSFPDGFMRLGEVAEFDREHSWIPFSQRLGNIYDNPELLGGEAEKV
ncbi:YopX family protein [Paenibacillus donghaensis]|uniref:YopX protein domain-containing protein n=1 Tax=Paenibacillus donghaensis TaxID=414771 RepID=A0A2Z2KFX0_9BACL|nr:YopX family protein [Paenibacillus donghaensis]ASA22020.1 hypothetical protein B9T62_15300 [Paenibacillus donghaensis]